MSNRGGVRDGAGRPKGEPTTMVRVPDGCLDAVRSLITDHKNQVSRPVGGIVLDWRPKTELPEPGRLVVARYGEHDTHWYSWGMNSDWLAQIIKIKVSTWHTREELVRTRELLQDWSYVPKELP